MSNENILLRRIEDLEKLTPRQPEVAPRPIFLTTPLTSTSWDGDDSKTAGTYTIDTSSLFSAPVGIKAASITICARWAATAGSFLYAAYVGSSNYATIMRPFSTAQDTECNGIVPCDSNGDFDIVIGNNITRAIIWIHGYWI